jgi:glycosyltransferase involved in cell wall biosynthesis
VTNFLKDRPHCGYEIWEKVSKKVPNILIGDDSKKLGGIGPIRHDLLIKKLTNYRVYFNPTTDSSVPMSMLEAMSIGMPVVTLATTDLPNIIKNEKNGFISNDINFLVEKIKLLIKDKRLTQELGTKARETIENKFSMKRFINEWNDVLKEATKSK